MDELTAHRHPAIKDAAEFFKSDHLRPENALHAYVSRRFESLARDLLAQLDDDPELVRALHKLMEAKDCAVRAAVRQMKRNGAPAEPNKTGG